MFLPIAFIILVIVMGSILFLRNNRMGGSLRGNSTTGDPNPMWMATTPIPTTENESESWFDQKIESVENRLSDMMDQSAPGSDAGAPGGSNDGGGGSSDSGSSSSDSGSSGSDSGGGGGSDSSSS